MFNKEPASGGVPLGSVIGTIPVIEMVNDLPEGSSVQREDIQAGLFVWMLWQIEMVCSLTRKKQPSTYCWIATNFFYMQDDNRTPIPLPLVSSTKDLGIMVNSSLKPTIQVNVAVAKARSM